MFRLQLVPYGLLTLLLIRFLNKDIKNWTRFHFFKRKLTTEKGEFVLNIEVTNLEEKERRLANYLETSTTEEVINEVQTYIPSLCIQSHIFYKLNQLKLHHSVKNTLIYYVLATNKKALATQKLLKLASLCIKHNINSAQSAIHFFKKYYVIRSKMVEEY
jgi:replication initiation and membrane attachment protein DnaB